MAKEAKKHPIKTFYIYDPLVQEVMGKEIVTKDGERTVRMTEIEAQYYIDQGALGPKPMGDRDEKAIAPAEQMIGTDLKKQSATEKPAKPGKAPKDTDPFAPSAN